ncbi:MAG: BA14K family protein [Phenylobacterium sp.]|nr:BA14K family protein [Phenylobacterium sp.]
MRKLITIGLAAISLAAAAGVSTASAQPRPYGDLDRDGVPNRYDRDRDGDGIRNREDRDRDNDGIHNRYDRDRDNDGIRNRNDRYDNRYGRWDHRWGRQPAPPPRHWRHSNSWYGHVRACQIRYRSYNPARDMYFTGRVWTRCRL